MTTAKKKISSLKTVRTFMKVGTCSESTYNVINRAFDNAHETEEKATMSLAGGIMQHGYQCGMVWGAAMAAGAESYRRFGAGPKAEAMAIRAAEKIVESFKARTKFVNCADITGIDDSATTMKLITTFLLKGGTIKCFNLAAKFAPIAFDVINDALAEEPPSIPAAPASCTAELARKMGATEEQSLMAAGLAGGIGLYGGACGALGAAIWLTALKSAKGNHSIPDYKSEEGMEVIDRFLQNSEFEFECSVITGHKFTDVADHANFLNDGGCSTIIEALANI